MTLKSNWYPRLSLSRSSDSGNDHSSIRWMPGAHCSISAAWSIPHLTCAPVCLIEGICPARLATATEKALRRFCRGRLANFKVPREIHFRDALPKGGTGKILQADLREHFWQGLESRVH